jgi:hypothetical protein
MELSKNPEQLKATLNSGELTQRFTQKEILQLAGLNELTCKIIIQAVEQKICKVDTDTQEKLYNIAENLRLTKGISMGKN